MDDRDAGLCVCEDGTLIVSWFTTWRNPLDKTLSPEWREHLQKISDADIDQWTRGDLMDSELVRRGHWIRRSTDHGRSWEEPVAVPVTSPNGPNTTADGRLVFVGNNSYRRNDRSSALACAESHDNGLSWQVIAEISMFPEASPSDPQGVRYLGEPHVVEVVDGRDEYAGETAAPTKINRRTHSGQRWLQARALRPARQHYCRRWKNLGLHQRNSAARRCTE